MENNDANKAEGTGTSKPRIRNPWERQANEPREAWLCFQEYRDQGLRRNVDKVAEKTGVPLARVRRYAQRWWWEERADAWDEELDRQRIMEQVEEVKDMQQRHTQIAQGIIAKGLQRLNKLDPEEIPSSVVIQYLRDAATLERQTRGDPEKILEERRRRDEQRDYAKIQEVIADQKFIRALQRAVSEAEAKGSRGSGS